MKNPSIERFYQYRNNLSFICVEFSIENEFEAQKAENDDNSTNEVIPSDGTTNKLAYIRE
jgi:hypothetical protein